MATCGQLLKSCLVNPKVQLFDVKILEKTLPCNWVDYTTAIFTSKWSGERAESTRTNASNPVNSRGKKNGAYSEYRWTGLVGKSISHSKNLALRSRDRDPIIREDRYEHHKHPHMQDRFIKGEDEDCGAIIMYAENKFIVCPNILSSNLQLTPEECLPQIRYTLFPAGKKV